MLPVAETLAFDFLCPQIVGHPSSVVREETRNASAIAADYKIVIFA